MPINGRIRIASNTKMFTAVVVLQLVGEGRIDLDEFALSCGGVARTHGVDAPGYVTRNGVTEDGRAATIVVTGNATTLEAARDTEAALDTALRG